MPFLRAYNASSIFAAFCQNLSTANYEGHLCLLNYLTTDSTYRLESSAQTGVETSTKTLRLNFINILRTAFTLADHKNVKKTVKWSIFFTLLGSASVKAVCRTLMKLSPRLKVSKSHKSDKFAVVITELSN